MDQFLQFIHVDFGNVISWVLIAIAWYASYIKQSQTMLLGLKDIQKWIDKHEIEVGEREKMMLQLSGLTTKLGETVESLKDIVKISERRIERLENLQFQIFIDPKRRPGGGGD